MKQMTLPQLQAWVKQDWRNGIHYTVDNNPRGAYNWIQAAIQTSDLPLWSLGFEATDANRLRMRQLLEKTAAGSGNPAEFTRTFMSSVQHITNTINWTKIIN